MNSIHVTFCLHTLNLYTLNTYNTLNTVLGTENTVGTKLAYFDIRSIWVRNTDMKKITYLVIQTCILISGNK